MVNYIDNSSSCVFYWFFSRCVNLFEPHTWLINVCVCVRVASYAHASTRIVTIPWPRKYGAHSTDFSVSCWITNFTLNSYSKPYIFGLKHTPSVMFSFFPARVNIIFWHIFILQEIDVALCTLPAQWNVQKYAYEEKSNGEFCYRVAFVSNPCSVFNIFVCVFTQVWYFLWTYKSYYCNIHQTV